MLIASATIQPTVAALVHLAIADGDFVNDLVPHADLTCLAADYVARGVDVWEDDQDVAPGTVHAALIRASRDVLISLGINLLRVAACDAADARTDALESGDADRNGNPIPYATYRSAA